MQKRAWTFRSKVLLVVIVTVAFAAMAILYSAQSETERAMFAAHDENALNLMNTVALNVESQYQSILFHEAATRERRKAELRNIVDLAFDDIQAFCQGSEEGRLSVEEAQRQALDTIRRMRYDDEVGYLWVNDTGRPIPRMLMHPTLPELDGSILDDPSFECAMGQRKNLFVAAVEVCEEGGSGYVDYQWPKPIPGGLTEERPKISYVRLFEPWGWIVGTGVYVDDIEAETQRRFEAVLVELKEALSKVRLAETGYLFIFTADKEMLVHPAIERGDSARLTNPVTEGDLLAELMEAAKTPSVPYDYVWSKPQHPNDYRFQKRAYVTHFKPLDWYIGASFYVEEMKRPAERLGNRLFFLSCLVLMAAVAFAVFVSKGLTEPLRRLTRAAMSIEREGIRSAEIPISGTAETIELGTILRKMISSIESSERDLKKASSFIRNIIDSMPSMLVGVDAAGIVTQWNSAAERMTGLARDEAVGQRLDRALPSLRGELPRVLTAILSREVLCDHRQQRREDGETRYEDVTVYPLVADGVGGAVIRVDDVTERVRIEEMMVQSEKMLSVGGLAAGMAHEINNPLAGMMQTASVLSSRLTDDLPANVRAAEAAGTSMEAIRGFMNAREVPRMLTRIRESGTRAAEIVANMLSFARKSDSAFSTQNLGDLMDQTVDLAGSDYNLKKEYDFRQIEIVREYEETPPVPCEASKIQQVLLNLLRNGAEAMHDGIRENGTDKKPRFVLRLAHERETGWVRMEIEDNGPGMNEETRKRVFEPFFTTKPTDRGTGLGLSVSYFIITETHRGRMSVESSPGEGTRFILRLPVGRNGHG